jgi:hypothetical protein
MNISKFSHPSTSIPPTTYMTTPSTPLTAKSHTSPHISLVSPLKKHNSSLSLLRIVLKVFKRMWHRYLHSPIYSPFKLRSRRGTLRQRPPGRLCHLRCGGKREELEAQKVRVQDKRREEAAEAREAEETTAIMGFKWRKFVLQREGGMAMAYELGRRVREWVVGGDVEECLVTHQD